MIKLIKKQEPGILARKKDSWENSYISSIRNGDKPNSNYNHQDIKKTLKEETHDKCAYCESKTAHVHWGDVEHILPKSSNQELVFDWNNLTYSCAICNSNKSNYNDPQLPLINPFIDNPSEFLDAVGPTVFHKSGNDRGEVTERIIKLNRSDLTEKRKERLESLNHLIDRWSVSSGGLKDLLENEIKKEAEVDKEFSFVVKSYISYKCGIQF